VGDLVRVTAEVEELQFGNALPLTQLNNPNRYPFEILSTGNPLPAPVMITDMPDIAIADGIAFWEPLEGMLVATEIARVAAATSGFGEFGLLTRVDAKRGSGFYPRTQQILVRSLGGDQVDYNPERILVDDSSLPTAITVQPGDLVLALTGVVDYTFGAYKLQPVPDSYVVATQDIPPAPVSTRAPFQGDTVITTFNVENLFDLVDNPDKDDESSTPTPEALETQLTKLAMALQMELQLPEILVAQEVENTEILQELGDRVNAANGTNYVATSFETSDARGIEVGFLWDANRVSLLEAFQLSDDIVPGVSAAFGPNSPSPGREPLVGVFQIEGRALTIVGNHFKSKSGDDPLFGVNWPPVRVTETQRKAQARVVRDYVNTILDADPRALLMVAGDLNDFPFAEPGEGDDHPVAILEGFGPEVPLVNLINLEDPAQAFTYVFDGNSQVLDHMLVSPALLTLLGRADVLHFNAGFPASLGDDPTTPIQSSDHDPLEGRFNFQ
jgi:predicted extracellular nuclease